MIEPMNVDTILIGQKMLTAIASLPNPMTSDEPWRPSSCGNCPRRLWYMRRDVKAGIDFDAREPKFAWMAMQGNLAEAFLREMLKVAGADVWDPPDESVEAKPDIFGNVRGKARDPDTDFLPHVDGAILWPEVGITERTILELKYLRAMAFNDLVFNGFWGSRDYSHQGTAYLKTAGTLAKNYGWDVQLDTLFFFAWAKDPSTASMFQRQKIKRAKYEDAPKNDEDVKKSAAKDVVRQRLEGMFEPGVMYSEFIHVSDDDVGYAWEDIKLTYKALQDREHVPEPLHNPTLPEGDLDVECAFYCHALEECRELQEQHAWKQTLPANLGGKKTSDWFDATMTNQKKDPENAL